MPNLKEAFQVCVDLIAGHPRDQKGITLLYFYMGTFYICHAVSAPKDAMPIIRLNKTDLEKGLTSEQWSKIQTNLNKLIEGGLLK